MMNAILVKIFATALTLSQITTRPDDIQVAFDPVSERQEVAGLLRAGCQKMLQTFDLEDIDLDILIETAMADPEAMTTEIKALNGLNLGDLHTAYKEYCKGETVANSPIKLEEVIAYYNKAVADLPDPATLKDMQLPGSSTILDSDGERYTEIYNDANRRISIDISGLPEHVTRAFVSAEDKRFFEHDGIDERSIVRAFISNFASSGRPQGGSTITQQVVKNLLVGDDITYERKMREMISASRVERILGKEEILELYLNQIYLGRASWGIEMAARSYFGKSARELTLDESAFLAALVKGPNYYNYERHPERVENRMNYVLNRMREDGVITTEEMKRAQKKQLAFIDFESPRTRGGFYIVDHVVSAAEKWAGIPDLTKASYTVKSTVDPELQKATEAALQEGLARYELNAGRFRFTGAEANLGEDIEKLKKAAAKEEERESEASPAPDEETTASEPETEEKPLWQQALISARLPLYDVHWDKAVVLEKPGKSVRVGLEDGRIVPLKTWKASIRNTLKIHDVVYVKVVKGKKGTRADLRIRPTVQGAALILENRTGRILAMAGGFSYPLSQLNRTTQMVRQPGSAMKPLTFLGALANGYQPNTLVWDSAITLPPVERGGKPWSPKNYDSRSGGLMTIRRGLELSRNHVTARLLAGGVAETPPQSMDKLCAMAREIGIYDDCVEHYPFILGAQPVRMVNLAVFYATIANEGLKPTPHVIESISKDGQPIYQDSGDLLIPIRSADAVSFYQLKTMLQGVVKRGTARRIKNLGRFVGGKTGTTDGENDAWFVGFTNEVTIAIWVGYDNAEKRRTLGGGFTGGRIAVPVFADIIDDVWSGYTQKTVMAPPSSRSRDFIRDMPIDLATGDRLYQGDNIEGVTIFREHFRLSRRSQWLTDTQFALASRVGGQRDFARYPGEDEDLGWSERGLSPEASRGRDWMPPDRSGTGVGMLWEAPDYRYQPPPVTERRRRPQRVDPDYLWQRLF